MSQPIIFFFFVYVFTTFHLPLPLPASPILPDPDPATVQTQTQTLRRPPSTPPATIPAFPEQSDASVCKLDLPEELFHGIKSACASKPHHRSDQDFYSGELHRSRCCPVLAAWLYSAYAKTGLSTTAKPPSQSASYDMPVLPDDSETCVDTLEKALGSRGVELGRPNETCDVVYCYCGIRLHPFSCPEAFRVNSRGEVVGGEVVERLERDCLSGGYDGVLGGCSKCLKSLHSLNGTKAGRRNRTERTSRMHNQDCELMGLSWLLKKDRSAYIRTVSAVLRALMMSKGDTSDSTFCSLNSDGMPLAVDSSEINQSSSSFLAISLHDYSLLLSFLYTSFLFLFSLY